MTGEFPVPEDSERDAAIAAAVGRLCTPEADGAGCRHVGANASMPSLEALAEIMALLRTVLFPGYFGPADVGPKTVCFHVGGALDRVAKLLAEQVRRGYCFVCAKNNATPCTDCEARSEAAAVEFVRRLPEVRDLLASDVQAAYDGDPAAKNPGEIIFCYPSLKALTNHRIAHVLHLLGVDIIPRIIAEMAHSETGIDIHPGARIGPRFFIDHGTGTVIGETCIIGRNVRLYQGVTLGAKSFPKDESGRRLVKGLPRHPIVEDDVIVYAGATILGRVTIGRGAVIGGNVWVTHDVAPGARVVQVRAEEPAFLPDGAEAEAAPRRRNEKP